MRIPEAQAEAPPARALRDRTTPREARHVEIVVLAIQGVGLQALALLNEHLHDEACMLSLTAITGQVVPRLGPLSFRGGCPNTIGAASYTVACRGTLRFTSWRAATLPGLTRSKSMRAACPLCTSQAIKLSVRWRTGCLTSSNPKAPGPLKSTGIVRKSFLLLGLYPAS
jgi:hypothetical protein